MGKTDSSAGVGTASDGCSNIFQNLTKSGLSSMEQFLTFVRIEKKHPDGAVTPGFRGPSPKGDEDGSFKEEFVGPTIHELDPYFSQIFNDDGTRFMVENDYRILNHDLVKKGIDGEGGNFNLRKAEDKNPGTRAAIKTVMPMNALRGPLIISGWGYGMDDFPVPSNGQSFPSNAQFDQELVHDRRLWKTGPVHLMWDDERQVWQGGYHIVCGVVDGAIVAPPDVCSPTEFTVNLFRNTKIRTGEKLSDTTEETIQVQNRDPSLEQDAVPNAIFCIAIKLNYEWLPLWVGCPDTPACPKPDCIVMDTCGDDDDSRV